MGPSSAIDQCCGERHFAAPQRVLRGGGRGAAPHNGLKEIGAPPDGVAVPRRRDGSFEPASSNRQRTRRPRAVRASGQQYANRRPPPAVLAQRVRAVSQQYANTVGGSAPRRRRQGRVALAATSRASMSNSRAAQSSERVFASPARAASWSGPTISLPADSGRRALRLLTIHGPTQPARRPPRPPARTGRARRAREATRRPRRGARTIDVDAPCLTARSTA